MTILLQVTPNSSNGGDQGSSHRSHVILTASGLGSQVRVTFQADADGWDVDHCAIGAALLSGAANLDDSRTLATPIELTFSGNHGFSIGPNVQIISDWVTDPGLTTLVDAIVIMDSKATGNNSFKDLTGTAGAGVDSFFGSGSPSGGVTWNLADPGARTGGSNSIEGYILIEAQGGTTPPPLMGQAWL